MVRIVKCHPNRKHFALGLCESCYGKEKHKRQKESGHTNSVKARCHPDRPHVAKGKCKQCYKRYYRKQNPNKCKKLDKEKREKRKKGGWENPIKARCHPDRPHLANGKCKLCYYRDRMRVERKKNPKYFLRYSNEYYHKNKARLREKRNEDLKKKSRKYRQEFLDAYGRVCTCCGETNEEFLTAEHLPNRWGRELKAMHEKGKATGTYVYRLLKKLNWPKRGITVLCINCNYSRGMYGYCPHNKKSGRNGLTEMGIS